MSKDKRPAIMFYIGDWMKDPGLRMCSVAARGLWMDLLCIMKESKSGYSLDFTIEDKEPLLVARMTGVSTRQVKTLMAELDKNEVSSRDDSGRLYSRRLKRDLELSRKRYSAGIKGGNPALVKDLDNQTPKQKPRPSFSSSTSSSNKESQQAGDPSQNQDPRMINLREIKCGNLSEAAKHKIFNKIIEIFKARGWVVNGIQSDLPMYAFKYVAQKLEETKPRNFYPYFEASLKSYINENAETLRAQAKIDQRNGKKTGAQTIGQVMAKVGT